MPRKQKKITYGSYDDDVVVGGGGVQHMRTSDLRLNEYDERMPPPQQQNHSSGRRCSVHRELMVHRRNCAIAAVCFCALILVAGVVLLVVVDLSKTVLGIAIVMVTASFLLIVFIIYHTGGFYHEELSLIKQREQVMQIFVGELARNHQQSVRQEGYYRRASRDIDMLDRQMPPPHTSESSYQG